MTVGELQTFSGTSKLFIWSISFEMWNMISWVLPSNMGCLAEQLDWHSYTSFYSSSKHLLDSSYVSVVIAEFCIFCSNMFCIAFLSLHALKKFFLPLTMYFSVYRYFFPGIHYFLVEVKSKILSTLNSNDSLSSKGMEDALPSLNL